MGREAVTLGGMEAVALDGRWGRACANRSAATPETPSPSTAMAEAAADEAAGEAAATWCSRSENVEKMSIFT